jgi:hypothetical protein
MTLPVLMSRLTNRVDRLRNDKISKSIFKRCRRNSTPGLAERFIGKPQGASAAKSGRGGRPAPVSPLHYGGSRFPDAATKS